MQSSGHAEEVAPEDAAADAISLVLLWKAPSDAAFHT
jgi:hypothetical protein